MEHGLHRWDWAAGALIAEEAGAVVRVPIDPVADGTAGAAGTRGPAAPADDGLGADITVAASPGIAEGLHRALREFGAGQV